MKVYDLSGIPAADPIIAAHKYISDLLANVQSGRGKP